MTRRLHGGDRTSPGPIARHGSRASSARWPAALLLAFSVLAAGPADAQSTRRDPLVALPDPMPPIPAADAALLRVGATAPDVARSAIDPDSLAIAADKAFRYTLVVTSTSGVRNVSHEAIRCDAPERRILAIARTDGTWSVLRTPSWQPIRFSDSLHQGPAELFQRLCVDGTLAGQTPADLLTILRSERYRIIW